MIFRLLSFVLLMSIAIPAQAQLEDIEFEGSNLLRFDEGDEVDVRLSNAEYPDNTIARHFIENRLRLDLYGNGIRVGGRLLYFRPSEEDVVQYGLDDENRFDKRYVEATVGFTEMTFGHFSDLWANGLVLSLYENRDLYYDSELDGVHLQMGMGPLRLTGLRGTTADGFLVKELEVSGVRVEAGESSTLGFSYVRNDSGFYDESHVSGVDWNISRGILNLYGEVAWNETFFPRSSYEGHAQFLGVGASKWKWSLLLEYNNYDYGSFTAIQNPPATYREIGPRLLQGREPHFLNIANEVGYQAELSGSVTEELYTTFHYNLSSHHPADQSGIAAPSLDQEDSPFWELYGNLEYYLPGDRYAFLEVGANEEASTVWQDRNWVHARYTMPFRDDQELEFEVEQLLITEKRPDEDRELHDQLYSVGWTAGNNFSLVLIYQRSDDDELKRIEGDNWLSGEMAVTFGGGKHRALLFYGKERGGLKCSNGVCREVQAFSGFRLSLETTL